MFVLFLSTTLVLYCWIVLYCKHLVVHSTTITQFSRINLSSRLDYQLLFGEGSCAPPLRWKNRDQRARMDCCVLIVPLKLGTNYWTSRRDLSHSVYTLEN